MEIRVNLTCTCRNSFGILLARSISTMFSAQVFVIAVESKAPGALLLAPICFSYSGAYFIIAHDAHMTRIRE